MRTECKQVRFEFHQLSQRKVKARFDGGKITSDAGVLLLREVERGTGLIAGLAECFRDHRDARLIEHTVEELLGQRIYGLCLGYEDLNDHDQLRTDPMLAVAVNKADPLGERRRQASDRGKALAGRCTLNRVELTGAEVDEQERYKKIAMDPDRIDGWMVDAFVESHESAPEEIVLDLDATDDPIHGQQEGRFFHGYYRHYCYLPLYIFSGEHLLCARLRCSNIDGAAGSVEELERIVGRIRQSWPEVSIVIRADSGFCRDDLLRWCEDHHVDYVMGLANNDRLKSESAEAMTQAEAEFNATGTPARVFKDFRYRTRHSWTSERRVVGKAEFLEKGANPRFVVTSLSPERLGARAALRRLLLCAGRHGEPHKRTAVGSVRRPDQRGNDARQSTPAVSVLRRLHAHARLASSRTEADPPGSRSVSDDSLEAPEDRRPGPPHGPPRLDLHVGSLSLQRGLRCRRSKPPGHSSALLRSVPIKRPQKRNRSIAQAELCLNAFRHALPNPKNAPFTTLPTPASLDLDRIDSETLRKPFRPAKITFISKSVIYAGYLRHAAVMGLAGCARAADLAGLAADPSPAVRMSAVLALRRLGDPRVSRFLRDAQLEIVTAAARAIHDVPIEAALPDLAALIGEERFLDLAPAGGLLKETLTDYRDQEVLEGGDPSLRYTLPLLLRVVNANWRVGKAEHAEALAGLAGSREAHWLLRGESLRRLTEWDVDARLDPLLGVYRPFSSNSLEPGRKAALAVYEGLLHSERDDLLQATMALVGHYEIKEAAPVLARLARLGERSDPIRSAALESLTDIGGATALETVRESLDSPSPRLRGVALKMLARLDPPAVKSRIEKTLREGERLEKQAALELVSELGTPETDALLLELMDQLQEKTLDPAIQLDVLEACRASKVPEIEARVARFEKQADQWDQFGLYRTAMDGGSEGTGRAIFFFNSGADCKCCHVVDGVGGGMVGPDLSDLSERLTREEILEAIVDPNRTIAEGYEMVDIILKDGRDFSGRVLREDEEKLVLEQDISFYEFDSKDGLAPHSEVDVVAEEVPAPLTEEVVIQKKYIQIRRSSQSGMPEDVVDSLPLSHLRDLIAFLASKEP